MTSADLRATHPLPDRRRRRGGSGAAPVFLDRTGRRRRLMMAAGLAYAAVLLTGMALLTVGLFSGSPLPLPGWPGPADPGRGEIGAGQVGASPTPVPGEGDGEGDGDRRPDEPCFGDARFAKAAAIHPFRE